MKRMTDKIKQVETYLKELKEIAPKSLDKYISSLEKKAACERYVEKIVEAVIDLAFIAIKERKLRMPESDTDAFNILLENGIIDEAIALNLKKAKGMRNFIAHEYGEIDNKIVFNAISKELGDDVKRFVDRLERTK